MANPHTLLLIVDDRHRPHLANLPHPFQKSFAPPSCFTSLAGLFVTPFAPLPPHVEMFVLLHPHTLLLNTPSNQSKHSKL